MILRPYGSVLKRFLQIAFHYFSAKLCAFSLETFLLALLFVNKIKFGADKHYNDIIICIFLEFLHPTLNVIKAGFVGDVVDNESPDGPAEVSPDNSFVPKDDQK